MRVSNGGVVNNVLEDFIKNEVKPFLKVGPIKIKALINWLLISDLSFIIDFLLLVPLICKGG